MNINKRGLGRKDIMAAWKNGQAEPFYAIQLVPSVGTALRQHPDQ